MYPNYVAHCLHQRKGLFCPPLSFPLQKVSIKLINGHWCVYTLQNKLATNLYQSPTKISQKIVFRPPISSHTDTVCLVEHATQESIAAVVTLQKCFALSPEDETKEWTRNIPEYTRIYPNIPRIHPKRQCVHWDGIGKYIVLCWAMFRSDHNKHQHHHQNISMLFIINWEQYSKHAHFGLTCFGLGYFHCNTDRSCPDAIGILFRYLTFVANYSLLSTFDTLFSKFALTFKLKKALHRLMMRVSLYINDSRICYFINQ